jgi:hypothetical protein
MLMLSLNIRINRSKVLCTVVLSCLAVFIVCTAQVFAIARGYTSSDEGLDAGMVAALSESGTSEVERADQNNSKRIVGVVTTFEESSVTLASGDSKVLVESEGEIDAYISDIGGKVSKGDLLVLSSFKGILMKAGNVENSIVVGVAAEDSDATATDNPTHYTYQDNGATKSTEITKIKVNLNKQGTNTAAAATPSPLAKLGESVTGKQVSDIRVLAALTIFILVMIAEGGIIYGAVTSAITALGRNPMARQIIRREMTRVIIVAIVVLSLGLGAVYGVLWY